MRSTLQERSTPAFTPATVPACIAVIAIATAAVLFAGPAAGKRKAKQRLKHIASALSSIPESKDDRTLSPYFFVLSDDPQTDQFPLKSTAAEVSISGVIADVAVRQTYCNEGQTTLEAIYIFPASTKAAVHGMRMTIADRVIEAQIKKRAEARKKYEKAKRKGQSASLLEQQRPNVFQMSVANIQPGDQIEVELRYTELLVPEETVYEFVYPTVVGPRYSNTPAADATADESWVENPYLHEGESSPFAFGIDVRLRSGIPIARLLSPSHDVETEFEGRRTASIRLSGSREAANRDFVLRYSLAGSQIDSGLLAFEGKDENYFLLMVEPPARVEPKEVVAREYIFILDVSGSMSGFPLDVSKRLVKDILGGLAPRDAFNILLFAGGSEVLAEQSLKATPDNIKRGIDWVDNHYGGGGTELLPALKRALNLPRADGTSRIVVVATDGYVTVEKDAYELVRKNLGAANLFPFGIGSSVNRELVEGLARSGMGEPFVVLEQSEASQQADRFRRYVRSPVLQGIEVGFDGFDAYDVEPKAVPDLFAGRPIVLFGKYKKGSGSISIKGTVPGGSWERKFQGVDRAASAANSALPYLWARHRIRQLDDMNLLALNDTRVKEVTKLGLKYHLLTKYTSFVAVDEVVRKNGKKKRTVRQPLPLPAGVSDAAVGNDPQNALGALMGGSVGTSYGYGGLGLRGTGRGGGGTAQGTIGLGSMGTVGHGAGGGSGAGYGRGASAKAVPRVRAGAAMVRGHLSKEPIQRIIKRQKNAIRACYEKELQSDPNLAGRVVVKFIIDGTGKVTNAVIEESTLNNKVVEACLLKVIKRLTFPQPAGGSVIVVSYPFTFSSQ
jgi:Ca-activated chloride channel family protein